MNTRLEKLSVDLMHIHTKTLPYLFLCTLITFTHFLVVSMLNPANNKISNGQLYKAASLTIFLKGWA